MPRTGSGMDSASHHSYFKLIKDETQNRVGEYDFLRTRISSRGHPGCNLSIAGAIQHRQRIQI